MVMISVITKMVVVKLKKCFAIYFWRDFAHEFIITTYFLSATSHT